MKIYEYLCTKYQTTKPTTMLGCEARAFGIGWPLPSGWLDKFGDVEITQILQEKLLHGLKKSARNQKKKLNKKGQKHAETISARLLSVDLAYQVLNKRPVKKYSHVPFAKQANKLQAATDEKRAKQQKSDRYIASLNVAGDAFLSSYEWRKIRLVILKKYGRKCQCCGATPTSGAIMNVDHIKPRKIYPELALTESNLQVLCHECNHGKGNWDMTDFRPEKTHENS